MEGSQCERAVGRSSPLWDMGIPTVPRWMWRECKTLAMLAGPFLRVVLAPRTLEGYYSASLYPEKRLGTKAAGSPRSKFLRRDSMSLSDLYSPRIFCDLSRDLGMEVGTSIIQYSCYLPCYECFFT